MNVLITGAAGFLGSHLMLHHIAKGDAVLGLDCFASSDRDSDHVKLISQRANNDHSMLINCDITSEREFFRHVDGSNLKFDLIYNFACPASPPIYQSMPIFTLLTCVIGLKHVMMIAQRDGAKVVHASTSEVYGDPNITPQPESYRGCVNSYGPRSCYDEGKRAAEALCFDYLNKHGVDARMVRIFNTYGPHMHPHDGRVVSNFICQALRGEQLTVYGDGKQSRSFCFVDDLIRAIVAMGALKDNPRTPINIGNPNEFTMLELAQKTIKLVHGEDNDDWLTYALLPADDPMQRCPDITLARTILNWEPKIQLESGLERTIGYFRKLV